jgi:hypothetical protein
MKSRLQKCRYFFYINDQKNMMTVGGATASGGN